MVKCADLFSGIGGLTLSLEGVAETVLYCDINTYCQQVLYERMKEGKLPRAPIHSDITTLYLGEEIEMLTAGFPCVSISSIGLREGIKEDTQSGLFLEVMRLVDESPNVKVVFLENVSNILKVGMKEVIDELIKRDFAFAWTMRSAGQYGAPHCRNRWYCLAVRGDFDINRLKEPLSEPVFLTEWTKEPCERFSFKPCFKEDATYDSNWAFRSQALGNTVCPHAVREAFKELVKVHANSGAIMDCFKEYSYPIENLERYPENGWICKGTFFALPAIQQLTSIEPSISITMNHNDNVKQTKRFPTARRGIYHASRLTDRSLHDLPTVLINCEESRERMEEALPDKLPLPEKLHTIAVANVNYIEWMFGYPKDWTKITCNHKGTTKEQQRKEQRQQQQQKVNRYNGMHAFMRECTHKDIKTVASLWRQLTKEEKERYSRIAKAL